MGRVLLSRTVLVGRLAGRDLRYRPAQAAALLLVIAAATATLTLGLALHGVTSQPYQRTRAATQRAGCGGLSSGHATGRATGHRRLPRQQPR